MEKKLGIQILLEEWERHHSVQLRIEDYSVSVGRPAPYTLVLNGKLLGSKLDIVHKGGITALVGALARVQLVATDSPEILAEKVVGEACFYDGLNGPYLPDDEPYLEAQIVLPQQTVEHIERMLRHYDNPSFSFELDGVEDRNGAKVWDTQSNARLLIIRISFGVVSGNRVDTSKKAQLEQLVQTVAAISARLHSETFKIRLF